jgi:hypothetical protein
MEHKTITFRLFAAFLVIAVLSIFFSNGYSGNKIRIACIGNSITQCAKVENPKVNSFSAQLASMLEEDYEV